MLVTAVFMKFGAPNSNASLVFDVKLKTKSKEIAVSHSVKK
jgi:hypothetical protein